MINGVYTILLLILSNVFMTFAWYGHLRLQQSGISTNWPLYLVIAFSWMIAFFEYCCQVPANRIGFVDNGGPLQPGATEGDSGVYLAGGLRRHCQPDLPARATALEPCRSCPLPGGSGIFRIYEAVMFGGFIFSFYFCSR